MNGYLCKPKTSQKETRLKYPHQKDSFKPQMIIMGIPCDH